uniref:Uncharacterized protein n=1 Tax=Coccidioides posadasii RMSCC 3488 TaxID=454284 RepID=A0A0J6HZL3_COCPO|nr:hypothetical protein CPAG_00784 [Coccidioides posadasii RMSCC 3488]
MTTALDVCRSPQGRPGLHTCSNSASISPIRHELLLSAKRPGFELPSPARMTSDSKMRPKGPVLPTLSQSSRTTCIALNSLRFKTIRTMKDNKDNSYSEKVPSGYAAWRGDVQPGHRLQGLRSFNSGKEMADGTCGSEREDKHSFWNGHCD